MHITKAELEILNLIGEGKDYAVPIGAARNTANSTVHYQLESLESKGLIVRYKRDKAVHFKLNCNIVKKERIVIETIIEPLFKEFETIVPKE